MGETLRDRKKAQTMHRVQSRAMDLFERDGFDGVTIEQIAADAEVSPSTIYRYFGTKEGLVIHDEHDDLLIGAIEDALQEKDLWSVVDSALQLIDNAHFVADRELTVRRTRLWFEVPSVRAATHAVVEEWIDRLTDMLIASPHHEYAPDQARIVISAQIWGIVAAIEIWYRNGANGSLGAFLRESLELIRPERPG